MKKLYLSVLTLFLVLVFPASSFAIFSKTMITSGPTGPYNSGWYTAVATVNIQTEPVCSTGPGLNLPLYSSAAPQNIEGVHHIVIFSSNSGTPHDIIYDTINGNTYSNELWRCAALDQPDHEVIEEYIFDKNISYDFNNPSISIASPGNNTNADTATVLVTGSVSDSGSGVRSVVIKGVNATVSGSTYSASVPLSNGLNTLTAIATDNAGRTSQAQVVVNRINTCGGACSAPSGGTSTLNTSTQQAPVAVAQPTSSEKNNETAKSTDEKSDSPTLVKGVVQNSGIGLATVFAFIIILLILDRLRIIEIKAFSKISDKFTKSKQVKKTSKKSS